MGFADFFRKKSSSNVAKDRLKLVLVSDQMCIRDSPEGSRATFQYDKQVNRLLTEENLDKVEKLGKIADELNITMSVLALAWILNKPLISSVITGASNPNQLLSNLAASGFTISKEVDDQIEKILNFERFERNIG